MGAFPRHWAGDSALCRDFVGGNPEGCLISSLVPENLLLLLRAFSSLQFLLYLPTWEEPQWMCTQILTIKICTTWAEWCETYAPEFSECKRKKPQNKPGISKGNKAAKYAFSSLSRHTPCRCFFSRALTRWHSSKTLLPRYQGFHLYLSLFAQIYFGL